MRGPSAGSVGAVKPRTFSVGLQTFVAAMCSAQVLIVIVAFAWTDVTIQDNSISTLKSAVESIATSLENGQLEGARQRALTTLTNHVGQLSRCAEHLANHIRDTDMLRVKQDPSTAGQVHPVADPSYHYLLSLVTYFDLPYAYLGTRESFYMHVERRNQEDLSQRPHFEVATNFFNGPPIFPEVQDFSTFNIKLTEQDELNFSSTVLGVEGYNMRMRPWYQQTRSLGRPNWVTPYLWLPTLELGSDTCVPVYDHSGLPKIDQNADPDPTATWSESLAAVACCADSLEGLSHILSEFDLGMHGVAFIVEADGDNVGMLIAAAVTGKALPVARLKERGQLEDGFDTSSAEVERLSAELYPEETAKFVSVVAGQVLKGGRSWGEVKEENMTFSAEDVGDIGVRTSVLDRSVSGWRVGHDGRWDGSSYQTEGHSWVFVIAQELLREDLDEVNSGLSQLRSQTELQLPVIGCACVVFSFFMTHFLLRNVSRSLREVCRRMLTFRDQLQFDEARALRSHVSEVNTLMEAYKRMQKSLQVLAKYVPPSVLRLGGHYITGRVQELQVGELRMVPEACTVMCISFARAQHEAEDAARGGEGGGGDEGGEVELHFQKVQAAAEAFEGEIIDFTARRVTVLFTGGAEPGGEAGGRGRRSEHPDRACRAGQNLLQGRGRIPGCVGISTGVCMVGNYGTAKRMKFGAVGSKLEIARRLCGLAETYNLRALVGENTALKATEVFPQSPGGLQDEVGMISTGEEHEETRELKFYSLPNVGKNEHSISKFRAMSTSKKNLGFLRAMSQSRKDATVGVEMSFAPPSVAVPNVTVDLVHAQPQGHCEDEDGNATARADGSAKAKSDAQSVRVTVDNPEAAQDAAQPPAEGAATDVWRGPGVLVPGIMMIVLICALQIIASVAALSLAEIPILRRSSELLNITLHETVNATATRILAPLTQESIDVTIQKLTDMPKCSEMLATEFRHRRFDLRDETVEWSTMFLHSMTVYYDVLYAYYGTRANRYMELERRNQEDPSQPPTFTMATNMYNAYPDNVTKHTDTSLVRFSVDDDGFSLLDTADDQYAPGFNPRRRPWYDTPRSTTAATWVEPFVYVPGLFLGIDACIPVYDDSQLPKRDPNADPDPAASWNESLEAVVCCDNSLDTLSHSLSELELGPNGIVFIVQAEGANAGLVVGAATPGMALPTSRAIQIGNVKDGFDTSEIRYERLPAEGYPAEGGALVSKVTLALLQGRTWADVGEEDTSFDLGGDLGQYSCSTKVLDGTVPDWRVGHDGRWNGSEYRLVGMSWRLVVAVRNEDFVHVAVVLEANDEQIRDQLRFAVLMVVILCVASIVLSCLLARIAAAQLATLRAQMERVDQMQLDRSEFRYSVITEIQSLQGAFEEMREWLERLQRYIPPHVTNSLNVQTVEFEACIREGTLGMTRQACSVMSILIPGFLVQSQASHQSNAQEQSMALNSEHALGSALTTMSRWLECIFAIIVENGGVVDDFEGDTITAFWRGGDVHAAKACLAAEKIAGELKNLLGLGLGPATQQTGDCFIGLHSGRCHVGNYGTSGRLKYGVSERVVARTVWQARIGKSIGSPILLHHNTRESVTGYFLSQFARTTELGLLYEMVGMSNTFAMVNEAYGTTDASKTKRRKTVQQFANLNRRAASLKRLRSIKTFHVLKERSWDQEEVLTPSTEQDMMDEASRSDAQRRSSANGSAKSNMRAWQSMKRALSGPLSRSESSPSLRENGSERPASTSLLVQAARRASAMLVRSDSEVAADTDSQPPTPSRRSTRLSGLQIPTSDSRKSSFAVSSPQSSAQASSNHGRSFFGRMLSAGSSRSLTRTERTPSVSRSLDGSRRRANEGASGEDPVIQVI